MKPREQIKQMHEDDVIEQFLSWHNSKCKTQFTVIEKPEPPDAIAKDGNNYIWIEHADIYRSMEEAKQERSTVTPGEEPYERQEYPIFEPDKRTAVAFEKILLKKLSKKSYSKFAEKYGLGILLLTERDPLFSKSTLNCIGDRLKSCDFNNKGYFGSVYLGYRNMSNLVFVEVFTNAPVGLAYPLQ